MERTKTKFLTAHNIAWLAVLLAFIIVVQLFSSYLKIGGFSINIVLVPIVLGGFILGPLCGAILGFACGISTVLAAVIGLDPQTMMLIQFNPWLTVLICIVKTTAAGLLSAYLYKWISKKNKYAAVFTAAAAAPIINTLIFVLGAWLLGDFFSAAAAQNGQSVIVFIILVGAGWNFIIELALSFILAPAIFRITEIIEKRKY